MAPVRNATSRHAVTLVEVLLASVVLAVSASAVLIAIRASYQQQQEARLLRAAAVWAEGMITHVTSYPLERPPRPDAQTSQTGTGGTSDGGGLITQTVRVVGRLLFGGGSAPPPPPPPPPPPEPDPDHLLAFDGHVDRISSPDGGYLEMRTLVDRDPRDLTPGTDPALACVRVQVWHGGRQLVEFVRLVARHERGDL